MNKRTDILSMISGALGLAAALQFAPEVVKQFALQYQNSGHASSMTYWTCSVLCASGLSLTAAAWGSLFRKEK